MNVSRLNALLFLISFLLSPEMTLSQGYAGLGTEADGFTVPSRKVGIIFPKDHGPHTDFRIEWWYLTANLEDETGTEYGAQWTLFRSALEPGEKVGWDSPQTWMGHAAVTSAKRHLFAERLARGGIDEAGVSLSPFNAWIGNWQMRSKTSNLDHLSLNASGTDFSFDLTLQSDAPFIFHGDNGYSVKSASGQASYYYSQPSYHVSGTLLIDGKTISVSGDGWLDREWSSQPLAKDQTGWDWFSLRFEGGDKLMGFVLRGQETNFTSGTWISKDGQVTPLSPGEFKAIPHPDGNTAPGKAPSHWSLSLPRFGVAVDIKALNPNSWMETIFPYWEGPVSIRGSHSGAGYLEMTGYEK